MKNRILDFKDFLNESLLESDSISYLSEEGAVFGSSVAGRKDKINKTAIEEFKKIRPNLRGDIKEESMVVYGGRNSSLKGWHLKEKPADLGTNDYIKLGDKEPIKDVNGKLTGIAMTPKEINEKGIEFCGNGVYGVTRMLKALKKKLIKPDTQVNLYLNLKKPLYLIANAETGFQSAAGKLEQTVILELLISKAIKPNDKNQTNLVEAAKRAIKMGTLKQEDIFTKLATPSVGKEWQGKIKGNGKIDLSGFISKYGGKEFDARQKAKGLEAAGTLFDDYFSDFMDLYSSRFIEFLNMNLMEAGLPSNLMDKTKSKIKEEAKKMEAKRSTLKSTILKKVEELYEPKPAESTITKPVADFGATRGEFEEGGTDF